MNNQLIDIFRVAIKAVQPSVLVPQYLNKLDFNRYKNIYVAGAGKAAAAMAIEAENILAEKIKKGSVVVKYGHGVALKYIEQIEAGHPFPDENSVLAADKMIALFKMATADDLIIFLLSGGASALLTDIPKGYTLQSLNDHFKTLMNSGADIYELNAERKKLSAIKGGGLVKYANGATIKTFIISDVMGDDIAVIGSGPTAIDLPSVTNTIIGNNKIALTAAADYAQQLGYSVKIFENFLQGDAEKCAAEWIKMIVADDQQNCCYIAGGETTVNVKGNGKGGRNQHFALVASRYLKENLALLAAGTDGTDGPTDAAGALIDANTWNNDAENYLINNDAYNFFKKFGGSIISGPTRTNVMDIVITLTRI